ncbi:hypothetical protein [uncultured Polaribacter sp.]|uniref:hypothetical protein n=1 Tax=uncultured Polaribacter sp. TaxID=174711 RepID=UPI00260BAA0F|nr:hypothetical protein [uncultured Polaribacter sp.]
MIKYIKRKDLDVEKYNYCIENSLQSRIYAFSWYLDIVATNWDVLVLNDYKAVMPIPWKKKYGIKYVTQPVFCQQLGVFSANEQKEEVIIQFLNKVPKTFLKVSLNIKQIVNVSGKTKILKNYVLPLHKEYAAIKKDFSKGRKHAIKVGEKHNLQAKEVSFKSLLDVYHKHYQYKISEEILSELYSFLLKDKKAILLGVFKDDVFLGGAIFTKTTTRITYLFAAFSKEGRALQASSYLLNNVINTYQKTKTVLDFEGGNITSIGKFYRSFNAVEENYIVFESSLL